MLKDSLYYGKILLFGEYGIIEDSMGLSIPYSDYNGKFLISKESLQVYEGNEGIITLYRRVRNK